jgi:hypothetical protein
MNIADAVRNGFIQVQAVASQIVFNNIDQLSNDTRRTVISHESLGNQHDGRSKLSIRIESQPRSRAPYEINESESLKREKDVVEIESVQRLPRHRKSQYTTCEKEIIEERTTNIVDRELFVNRARSTDRPRQQFIEEVVIDDSANHQRRAKFDIKEDRHTSHREIVIESEKYVPPVSLPTDPLIINGTHRQHEVDALKHVRRTLLN